MIASYANILLAANQVQRQGLVAKRGSTDQHAKAEPRSGAQLDTSILPCRARLLEGSLKKAYTAKLTAQDKEYVSRRRSAIVTRLQQHRCGCREELSGQLSIA